MFPQADRVNVNSANAVLELRCELLIPGLKIWRIAVSRFEIIRAQWAREKPDNTNPTTAGCVNISGEKYLGDNLPLVGQGVFVYNPYVTKGWV